MREVFRGYLSGNGIRQASIVGEIAPDPTDASCFPGRFTLGGDGVGKGERFMLAPTADGIKLKSSTPLAVRRALCGSRRLTIEP
jgi:hypothetical protein